MGLSNYWIPVSLKTIFIIVLSLSFQVYANDRGADVYTKNCSVCHQPEGTGLLPVYPGLIDNAFIKGDPAEIVRVLINGRGMMPAFKVGMTAQEIADVSTYIRQHWHNDSLPVSVEFVENILQGLEFDQGIGRETEF